MVSQETIRSGGLLYWSGDQDKPGQARTSQDKPGDAPMPDSPNDHTDTADDASALGVQIIALLAKLTERFDSAENEEWRWLIAHSPSPLIVDILRDSTPMTLRVLDAIGRMEPVNGATISEQYQIPKGTISKITHRLTAQELITHERLPNNRKELLFRLTALGSDLFNLHRTFDEQMERGFIQFLQRYDVAALRLLVSILQDATKASFLQLGLQPEHAEMSQHEPPAE
jgi:DNA-binding MarR family transcriptional regulator